MAGVIDHPKRRVDCQSYDDCLTAGALAMARELPCKGCARYRRAAVEIIDAEHLIPFARLLAAVFED